MKKFLTSLALLIGLGLAVWVSAFLFVAVAVIGILGYIGYVARGFLTQRGILNPTPGVPPEEQEHFARITVIDGDYTKVKEEEV